MDRDEKGTAVGATGGALAGAAVGGPVGAVVGAGVGSYAGHHEAGKGGVLAPITKDKNATAASNSATGNNQSMTTYDQNVIRSVQQSLERRGFDVGPVDGVWGDRTQGALRDFQQANGMRATGELDPRTLDALGVAR